MMKQLIFILLLLTGQSFAQSNPDLYIPTAETYLFPSEIQNSFLLADEVSLREGPGKDEGFIRSLPIASSFTVLEKSDSIFTYQGIRAHWYRVEGEDFKGWLWGGFIAQQAWRSTADPSVLFLAGHEKAIQKDRGSRQIYFQIRAVRKGKEINRISFPSFARGFGYIRTFGSKGIRDLDDMFLVSVPCSGGCGCLTGDIVIFWNNRQFYKVLELKGTPDGEFSSGQGLIFPSDAHGQPGELILTESAYRECPPPCDSLPRTFSREYLMWNGYKLSPSGRPKDVRTFYHDMNPQN